MTGRDVVALMPLPIYDPASGPGTPRKESATPVSRRFYSCLERVGIDRNLFVGNGSVHSGWRGARRDGETSGKRRNAPATSPGGPVRPPLRPGSLAHVAHVGLWRRRYASHPMPRNPVYWHRLLKARLATGEKRGKIIDKIIPVKRFHSILNRSDSHPGPRGQNKGTAR